MQFASIATLFLAAIATASPNSPPVSPRADFLAVSVDVTGTDATGARCTVSCVELAVVVAACAASFVDELATIASCAGVSTTSICSCASCITEPAFLVSLISDACS